MSAVFLADSNPEKHRGFPWNKFTQVREAKEANRMVQLSF